MAFKAVIFDLGGVLMASPVKIFVEFSAKHGLPAMFMVDVFRKGIPDNAFCKGERGDITMSQLIEEVGKDCQESARENNLELPSTFSVKEMMESLHSLPGNEEMINALASLKNHGIKTAILTNNFVCDQPLSECVPNTAVELLGKLRLYCDELIESCRTGLRKPDPEIYTLACQKLGVSPQETIFIDDLNGNVEGAKKLGITTIKFEDTQSVLKKLQELTGIDVSVKAEPTSVDPGKVNHGYVSTTNGVRIHYVEMGEGPVVVLCHGFPESWYSWRKQIPALVLAGYRVIVPDQRGYGDSSSPPDVKDYSHDHLCADLIALLDSLSITQATFVGHDWGGSVVWKTALAYPERTRGVVGVNTPYFPPNPNNNPIEGLKKKPGMFDYQLYFQTPGVAEKELEGNLEKMFKFLFRASGKEDYFSGMEKCGFNSVRERGGILAGVPDDLGIPSLISRADLDYYIKQYEKSGLRGPLNWYRNIEENWRSSLKYAGRKIYAPALMVTAEKDRILTPAMSHFMEPLIPNLSRVDIENCGHWTQMEKPTELNNGLIKWLNDLHHKNGTPKDAKL